MPGGAIRGGMRKLVLPFFHALAPAHDMELARFMRRLSKLMIYQAAVVRSWLAFIHSGNRNDAFTVKGRGNFVQTLAARKPSGTVQSPLQARLPRHAMRAASMDAHYSLPKV
jgi:hypothetical protein